MAQAIQVSKTTSRTSKTIALVTTLPVTAAAIAIVASLGVATVMRASTEAAAAPAIDSAPALTITRKAPKGLSNEPGIRIGRISAQDGVFCYRASRALQGSGRTISETFCTH